MRPPTFANCWTGSCLLLLSALLCLAPAFGKDASPPAVKKSKSGICHERDSAFYDRTTHFASFDSLQACLDSGGRRPSNTPGNRPAAKILAALCDGYVPKVGDDDVLYGRVVKVVDGDTFKAKIQGAVLEFRMSDIDAPEHDQPFGSEARAALSAAIDGKDVVMLKVDTDHHGRLVVYVWIANLHINRELVDRGDAWFYPEYAHDNCLFEVEEAARDAKRGLWALPREKRLEPWFWRESRREQQKASAAP